MKNKMKKFAVGALAAFMTVVSAVGTWASSAVFSSYGLSEPYTGDMQVTVEATVSKLDGSSTKEAIEGMKFSVYQVWTLDNDGRVVMNEKFAGVTVGEKTAKEAIENLVDLQDQTPASETYDLTYALADVEDKGAAFTGYGEGRNAHAGTGGGFGFYELGEPYFAGGEVNPAVSLDSLREYVWFAETRTPFVPPAQPDNPWFLGVKDGTALYLYHLPDHAATLNDAFLSTIRTPAEGYVIFAAKCALSDEFMRRHHITFKKIPRDVPRV